MSASPALPSYLANYADEYHDNPRAAALRWFREAKYGLFMHYGLYSLLANHEWVQFQKRIPVASYENLARYFTAEKFDAEWIADFAVECGMRYVNITTRHHDSFCLFHSRYTTFHTGSTPCGRDLVAELATACEKRGLGLCLYYSHGRDWKHPHAPNNDLWGRSARPEYDPPELSYAGGAGHDLGIYIDFMKNQITELLTNYGPVAAIWLDGIMTPLTPKDADGNAIEGFDPRTDGDAFRCQELYDTIHELQPSCLVSYKQGYLGTEDFFAPEHKASNRFGQSADEVPGEVCTTTSGGWGYNAGVPFNTPEKLWDDLVAARTAGYNLLANIGPKPSGEFPPEGVALFRAVAERIRNEGMPGE